jgi:hypothetical protein
MIASAFAAPAILSFSSIASARKSACPAGQSCLEPSGHCAIIAGVARRATGWIVAAYPARVRADKIGA